MSFALPATDLTSAVANSTGTVDWTKIAQSVGFPDPGSQPHLQFYNESPCELQLNFSTGEQIMLPAGGWQTIGLNAQCTHLSYTVLAVLNASPIIAQLYGTWYAPGEAVPAAPILGNSPIGGSVTTGNTAQILQGSGQTEAFTEVDVFQPLGPASEVPALVPVSGANLGLSLMGRDVSSIPVRLMDIVYFSSSKTVLDVPGSQSILRIAQAVLSSIITTYNGETTQGVGLPYIVALNENSSITSTALASILTYTTPNDGNNHSLRVNAWCDVNNGTSGNNLSLQVVYTDPRTGVTNTTPFSTATSTASQSFNGSSSISNGRYGMYPYMIYCKPNTVVTIQYRDPTNTPSDHVSAFIERIS